MGRRCRTKALVGLGKFLFFVAAITSVSCRASHKVAPDEKEDSHFIVQGWTCQDLESCFGLEVGRARVFSRQVGLKDESETWTIAEAIDGEDGARVFVQEGGPEYYEVNGNTLGVAIRGELVPWIVAPLGPESSHVVKSQRGGKITIRITRFDERVETQAGRFSPCFVQEAHFEKPEHESGAGLVVETTFCEGVGEVRQRLEVALLPLPVELELLALEANAAEKAYLSSAYSP